MNEQELYAKIISKYPQYANFSQEELLPKIYAKYPQYRDSVTIEPPQPQQSTMQKVITQARGFNPVGFLPINKAEALDVGKVGLRQFVPDNPGLVGFGANLVDKRGPISLPKPETDYGRNLEMSADMAQLAYGVGALKNIVKTAPKNTSKQFGKLRRSTKKAQGIADNLYDGAKTARKNVGDRYQSYIDKFGDNPVDEKKFNAILDQLPEKLKKEVMESPEILKDITESKPAQKSILGVPVSDASKPLRTQKVRPTLRNAKKLRDVVRGEVSTTHWKPKMVDEDTKRVADALYDEIGGVMRENNEPLAKIMGEYAEVRRAGDEVYSTLRTPKGYTKTRPIENLYREGADGAKQQAFEALAKENPDIWDSLDDARKFGNSVRRGKQFKKFGEKAGKYVAYGALGGGGLGVGYKAFGG